MTKVIESGLLVSLLLLAVTVPFSIAASQMSLGLVLLFWLLKLGTQYRREMLLTPLSLGMVAWVVATFVAALLGDNPKVSLIAMREEWLFLAFFAIWGGVTSTRHWRLIIGAFCVALFFSAAYSVWQHYTGLDLVHEVMLGREPFGYRTQSTFTHYLTAGGVLTLLGFLGLSFYWESRRSWRLTGTVVGVLGLLAALLTYSRSVLLAVAFGLGMLILLLWRQARWRILLPALLLVVATVATAPDVAIRFEDTHTVATSSGGTVQTRAPRLEIWQTAARIFLARPLTGVGEDNMLGRYSRYAPEGAYRTYATAHNDLLHIAATRGIIGLLGYALIWILMLRWFWQRFRAGDGRIAGLAALALALSAAYLVMSQFEAFFFDEEVRLTLFFALGLLAAGINLSAAVTDHSKQERQDFA